jgi:hypothetical protein
MPRKVQGLDHLPDGLVEQVEAAVRAAGAVPLGKLTRQKLGRRAQGQLFEALARRGLERTGRAVRVPLREQVVAALADGPIATSALRKRVRGASSAGELKLVVGDLARARRAAIVVRGGVEEVVAPSDQVLSAAELAAVGQLARDLGKAAAAVRGRAGRPARSLWRARAGRAPRSRAGRSGGNRRRGHPRARRRAEARQSDHRARPGAGHRSRARSPPAGRAAGAAGRRRRRRRRAATGERGRAAGAGRRRSLPARPRRLAAVMGARARARGRLR